MGLENVCVLSNVTFQIVFVIKSYNLYSILSKYYKSLIINVLHYDLVIILCK